MRDKCAVLHDSGHRQRDDVLSFEAFLLNLGDQLVGDVPGDGQGILRLIFVEVRLLQHGDKCSGHELADLERTFDLGNAIENPVVEAYVTNQSAGTRRRTDVVNVLSLFSDDAQQGVQIEFRLNDSVFA